MSSFQFKFFNLQQDHAALKVGTDSMVLGAMCFWENPVRLLDIGCGTGVLSLMCAQRFPFIAIDALEIDPAAVIDARENAQSNPFQSKITIFHQSLQSFHPEYKYDAIICNPPFFEASLKNNSLQKTWARHTDTLSFEVLFTHISKLLTTNGKAWLILPYIAFQKCESIWKRHLLHTEQYIEIHGKKDKPIRFIVCLSKIQQPCTKLQFVIRDENNQFTNEYKSLTLDFHNRLL